MYPSEELSGMPMVRESMTTGAFLRHGVEIADRRWAARLAHRRRHGAQHLTVSADGEGVRGDVCNTEQLVAGLEALRHLLDPDRDPGVRRPVVVRNPLHDIAVDPLEVAGHVARRADVDGPFSGAVIGHGSVERHHHRVFDPHHSPVARQDRSDAGLSGAEPGPHRRQGCPTRPRPSSISRQTRINSEQLDAWPSSFGLVLGWCGAHNLTS